jgi:hypothetical protein
MLKGRHTIHKKIILAMLVVGMFFDVTLIQARCAVLGCILQLLFSATCLA